MKEKITYLFLLFMATLIFYGGAGVNIVTYCCNDCRAEGVAVLKEKSCCKVHGHDRPFAGAVPDCGPGCDGCDVERVSFDWNSVHPLTLNLHPVVTDLISSAVSPLSWVPGLATTDLLRFDGKSPPAVCPRIYLSLLTTLLI